VHLNPVRTARMGLDKRARGADQLGLRGRPEAGIVHERVDRLRKYRWSSYRAYVGLEPAPEWLDCGSVLELGGRGTVEERQRAYARYVEGAIREGLKESPWEQLQWQLVLGGRELLESIRSKAGGSVREQPQWRALAQRPTWQHVVKAVEELRGQRWQAFRDRHGDWGRDLALYLGRRESGLRLRELGAAVGGVDYAAVSAAIKRFGQRLVREKSLRKSVDALRTKLLNVET